MARELFNLKEYRRIRKVNLGERITEALELPKEIVLGVPKVTIVGNGDMIIENYKRIIKYTEGHLKISSGSAIILIKGKGLLIKTITSENIILEGEIYSLEYTGME